MASVQAADDVGLQLSGGKAFHGGQQGAQGWGSGLWPAQLQAGAADDSLITPTNAEAPLLLSGGGGGSGARAAPQCLLCGGLGTSAVCGALRPATYEGQPAVVHHLCAVWSPGCFQREVGAGVLYAAVPCTTCLDAFPPPRSSAGPPRHPQGSSVYVNLEEEARRARNRSCSVCGLTGASLLCAHPG